MPKLAKNVHVGAQNNFTSLNLLHVPSPVASSAEGLDSERQWQLLRDWLDGAALENCGGDNG